MHTAVETRGWGERTDYNLLDVNVTSMPMRLPTLLQQRH